MDLRSRWIDAWSALGRVPDAKVLKTLLGAYSEPHRHYHTLQHLKECFTRFDELRGLAARPAEIELALWFHDTVYDTRRHDNEERSAHWAREAIEPVSPEAAHRVHELVMATRHDAAPEGVDARILVDVDLSILGATDERFDEFERQVRQEYAWVPLWLYRRERRRILAGLLARPALFSTARFVERYEAQARRNLARALATL